MNQQWRRNIKKADKAGVVVTRSTDETVTADLKAFHDLYVHTAERDHFTPRPLGYFRTMAEAMRGEEPDRLTLWLAHHEGDLVAATIAVRVGTHAWYSYGASSTEKRDVRGSNAVQWAMMRDALASGASVYDLRGITDTLDPDDPHAGLIQFKVGTGGEAVEHAGEWDLPLRPLLYRGFQIAMKRRADEPHPHGRRGPLARAPARGRRGPPRARAGREGQRVRLRARPAGPQGRLARLRHPGRRHVLRAARGGRPVPRRPAGDDPVAAVRRGARGARRPAAPGACTRSPGCRTCGTSRSTGPEPASCSSWSPACCATG